MENESVTTDDPTNPDGAEEVAVRLQEALRENDKPAFMAQLADELKAHGGYAAAAHAAGLNRTALYKILSPQGNPVMSTLSALLAHVGLRLSIEPIQNVDPQMTAVAQQLRLDGPPVLLPYGAAGERVEAGKTDTASNV
jgi:probable addiction module antidote protein